MLTLKDLAVTAETSPPQKDRFCERNLEFDVKALFDLRLPFTLITEGKRVPRDMDKVQSFHVPLDRLGPGDLHINEGIDFLTSDDDWSVAMAQKCFDQALKEGSAAAGLILAYGISRRIFQNEENQIKARGYLFIAREFGNDHASRALQKYNRDSKTNPHMTVADAIELTTVKPEADRFIFRAGIGKELSGRPGNSPKMRL